MLRIHLDLNTFSETTPETSDAFWVAISPNFHPTSATFPLSFDAPRENADQL